MEPTQLRCARCGKPMTIARFRCEACDVTVEGTFEVPPLGRLTLPDQVFVASFVRAHGNIRKMEGLYGISYPTVKNRLNAIVRELDAALQGPEDPGLVLDRLARGDITVAEALRMLPEP
ncbi:MAG: hypothetical protein AMK73_06760 [Planctomycetes bacterium SM23_32]|nr:MAG: hypothetical protein AMK73_06760 [Planctomycetes bacterium SM23_32]